MASSKKDARDKLKRRMSSYGGALTKKLKESLRVRGNIARGDLEKSIKTRSKWNYEKGRFRLLTQMNLYGVFLNKNMHPKTLPNLDAIRAWIDKKGIVPREEDGVRTKEQLTYLIARAIKKNGFATYNKHGIGWVDTVIDDEIKRLKGRVKKDLRDAVRNLAIETLDFNRKK